MKSKLEIYALSVCFTAMVCLVVASGIGGYSIFEITTPELTMRSHTYDKYQTNDAYWKTINRCYADNCEKPVRPNVDTLTEKRLAAFSVEVKGEKREGFQALLKCFIFILVGGIALLIHWRIAKNARE
tara:strand:- start:51 stop:434 length:384 start_codon:yes stop_codon:yes gene_type:complete